VLLTTLLVAACAGGGPASPRVPRTATPVGSAAPGGSGSSAELPSSEPGTASDEPSLAPSDAPATSDEPVSSDDASVDPGAAAECAGNDENRAFFVDAARAVDWTVYCPVLGSRWFVESGQYRRAGGGWMEIGYRGPAGARIALREGAPCTATDCLPTGTDLGDAAFGDLSGTLLDLGGGRYAVVVKPGATPSWTITGSGLDQATFEGIAAALVPVAG